MAPSLSGITPNQAPTALRPCMHDGRCLDAIVRVLIDMTDGDRTWTCVGVGTNVIEASWEALYDCYHWGLTKSAA